MEGAGDLKGLSACGLDFYYLFIYFCKNLTMSAYSRELVTCLGESNGVISTHPPPHSLLAGVRSCAGAYESCSCVPSFCPVLNKELRCLIPAPRVLLN